MAGFQLFFLFIIIDDLRKDERLLPWRTTKTWDDGDSEETEENKRRSIQDSNLWTHASLGQVRLVAHQVISLAEKRFREDDTTSQVVKKCEERIQRKDRSGTFITERFLVRNCNSRLKVDEAHLLLEEVRANHQSDNVTFEAFREWMVDAHKNCLFLAYTLDDAFAMVSALNVVLNCCIAFVVTLFWLLGTGLAATKVLVTIASIFVALSFMFCDTSKAFFQGVIFSFVSHPFDIGDRCSIDGIEVEVKRVGILTTTCIKIGTKEKMLYPNSQLSTKLIIKLEGEPDATDVIELVLHSAATDSQIKDLRECIEGYLKYNVEDGVYAESYEVKEKRMGERIKMNIHFKHAISIEDVSHSEWLRKKERQRSEFFMEIKQFLEELKIKVGKPYKVMNA